MKHYLYLPLLAMISLSSCSKDDEGPDYRAESLGNYSYTAVLTLDADNNVTSSQTGTLRLESTGSGGIRIIMDAGTADETSISSSALLQGGNGYVFNLSSFKETDSEGDQLTVSGVKGFELDGVAYDGVYDTGRQQLEVRLQADYDDNQYDVYNYSVRILATKK